MIKSNLNNYDIYSVVMNLLYNIIIRSRIDIKYVSIINFNGLN